MAFIDDDETLQAFKEESHEHLDGIESDLLAIEEAGADIDQELVNKVFRAMHSIKGGAGFLGMNAVKTLAHAAEDLLNKIRNKQLVPTPPVITSLLDAADLVNRLLNQPKGTIELDISGPLSAINDILSPSPAQGTSSLVPPVTTQLRPLEKNTPWQGLLVEHSAEVVDGRLGGLGIFILEYDLSADVEPEGLTSSAINDTLGSIGQVLGIQANGASVDILDTEMAVYPLPAYVLFSTMMDKAMLVSFANLAMDKVYEIQEQEEQPIPLPVLEPTSGVKNQGSAQSTAEMPQLGPPTAPIQKSGAAEGAEQVKAGTDSSLRVNVKTLDNLMTLAGELVLTRNQFLQIVHSSRQQDFDAVSQRLDLVTSELQEAIMSTRMQPVGNVFNKFKRVVRDLSQKLGKEIDLVIEGGEVEMDKTIIEALNDPLTHLVRNSVDHGIEMPDKRVSAGKPPAGTLQLRAFHEGGQVIIEIVDDGGGIDSARIKEKALSMGTHDKSQIDAMQEHELLKLIFLPGLSTAKEVTDVSGRGVGMDVVHANLSKVGGVFDISSKVGQGTTINIKLPLTLAIIPSLIVSVATERYAIPQVNMVELVRVPAQKIGERIERIGEALVIRLRGKLLPLIRLANALAIEKRYYLDHKEQQPKSCRRQHIEDRRSSSSQHVIDKNSDGTDGSLDVSQPEGNQDNRDGGGRRLSPHSAVNILVVSAGKFHYGLIVDKLLDSEEIVVKPLGSHLRKCQVYAGATIQGDGKVALILDVVGISKVMNLSSVSEQIHGRAQQEAKLIKQDAQTFLLVRNSPQEQLAIPLNLVSRIEKIRRDQIEITGGIRNMQYRGSTLPLFSIDEASSAVASLQEQTPHLYVVAFPFGEREVGIIVSEIIDIITVAVALDDTTHKQPGIMGSAIIIGQITMLVDLFGIVAKVMPDWIRHTNLGAAASGPVRHILVVEDSPFFNRQMCGFVSEIGCKAYSANDGVEGLAILEQEKIDLILTDIEMPNMDGLEFTTRVRADARWSGLPIIAVTSLSGDAAEKRGIKAGVDEYIVKLDREKIIHTINRYLRNGR